ncbi:hypothetical protein ACCAA_290003 [Candidatus Accumulibacter aalborgensis]|uniref:DNA binding HTH domain-containing protein n=1 Tax=Candidatus Accumulibacter aalborgensis TaxID=1860102 RepID=A0A1A8XPW8_9PROT|nr:hypothetical protein ACCAA_290003 [Candidatus Accumulibacter aalborgensis]
MAGKRSRTGELPRTRRRPLRRRAYRRRPDPLPERALKPGAGAGIDLDDPDLSEKERVVAALEQAGWVQAKAARILGMTPRQIAYRIQTLAIDVKQF